MKMQFQKRRIHELIGAVGLITDGDWVESKDQDPSGAVRLLQLADVGDGEFLNRSNRFLNAAKANTLRCTDLQPGDVLVARMGDPIGKACVFPGLVQRCVTVVDVCIVRTDPAICHPQWLVSALNSPILRSTLTRLATGATRARFPTSKFRELEIDLPPLDIQFSEARKLDVCRATIKTAAEGIGEQLRSSELLYKALFSLVFGGVTPISAGVTSQEEGARGWTWHSLSELARLESGHTPSRRRPEWWGGKVPWLALPDIRKLHGKFAYETTENTNDAGITNSSARMLPVGTVCVCRTASIGYVTILGKPMATSQDFCNWVCDPNKLDPEFLMYAFMASQDALRKLGSGAVHKTIYMPTIKTFQICAPEIAEQRCIARALHDRLTVAESLTTGLKVRLAEIERLPQRLLAVAFGHG